MTAAFASAAALLSPLCTEAAQAQDSEPACYFSPTAQCTAPIQQADRSCSCGTLFSIE